MSCGIRTARLAAAPGGREPSIHNEDELAADVVSPFAAPTSHAPVRPPAFIELSDLERKAIIDARAA